jgi:hypothetical protein
VDDYLGLFFIAAIHTRGGRVMQYLAVWYKSPEGMGPKIPATFTNVLTDNGLSFEVSKKTVIGPMRENSLGFALMENNVVVGCVTWIELGVKFTVREGDTVQLHPVTPTETKP